MHGLQNHKYHNKLVIQNHTFSVQHAQGRHTGEIVKQKLLEALKEHGLTSKFKFIVTDNGANIEAAEKIIYF